MMGLGGPGRSDDRWTRRTRRRFRCRCWSHDVVLVLTRDVLAWRPQVKVALCQLHVTADKQENIKNAREKIAVRHWHWQ